MEHFLEGITALKDIGMLAQIRRVAKTNILFYIKVPFR